MDYLILVAKKDLEIAKITIKSILTQDNEARIIVVTNECVLDNFIGPRITALDEDKFIKNLTLKTVRDIMTNLANQSERTGWYFQQFIKMAYSLIAERDYVVWESDTVMLKKIKFFEAGKNVLYFIDVMEHLPYLATMKRVLPNIQIIYNHSFICEKCLLISR